MRCRYVDILDIYLTRYIYLAHVAARRALVHVAAGAAVAVKLEAGGAAALVGAQRVETLVLARTGILTQVALDCR